MTQRSEAMSTATEHTMGTKEPRELTPDEFKALQRQCLDAGYEIGQRKQNVSDYESGIVVIDGKAMPVWMAKIFGTMSKPNT